MLTPNLLREIGIALYGDDGREEFAVALDVNPRNLDRMMAGKIPIPPDMRDLLVILLERRFTKLKRLLLE